MLLANSGKKCLKISYSVTSVLCRTKTTGLYNNQSVSDFYAGKSVFLTGGTGFLGKAYLEKLLRGCEEIDKVFILIRQKKGESIEARVNEMLKNPLFGKIRQTRPQVFNKIVPIIGDICQPRLGIRTEDEETLKNEVSVVIHSAATVRYREPLQVAMNINFEGTRRILDLCKRMRNLENFVYISTAYSQMNQENYTDLQEKVYPAPAKVEDVYDFIKKHPNNYKETVKFLGKHPNTYTFSKCLAENYIGENPEIPTTIVRPSGVLCTYKEPVKGWLDNWYVATGVCFDTARGLNHYMVGKPSNIMSVIPADYVVNQILIAGARPNSCNGKTAVYNSTSTDRNPAHWYDFHQAFIKENLKFGFYEKKPYIVFKESEFMVNLLTFLRMKVPAHVDDLILRLQGKEPRHVKMLNRVLMSRWSMDYFHRHSWYFKNDKARALYASLSDADKAKFPCDPTDIDWDEYHKIYFKGVTQYLLPALLEKEKSSFVPKLEALA